MTKRSYHPVGLAILRGSLQSAGFEVVRIRCIAPADDTRSWASYRITLTAPEGQHTMFWSPKAVFQACEGAFARDVFVGRVVFDGAQWIITINTRLGEESRPHLPTMGMIDQEPRQPLGGDDRNPEWDGATQAEILAGLMEHENLLTPDDDPV